VAFRQQPFDADGAGYVNPVRLLPEDLRPDLGIPFALTVRANGRVRFCIHRNREFTERNK
jgi:hypothetical protein